uniref:Uncharacterized protein n=1 Tax=Caenorhabditis japonica TaxID=281687 RepID=A0A8R1ED89_CAEJA
MHSIEFAIAPLVKTSSLNDKPIEEIAQQYCESLLDSKLVKSIEEVVRVFIQSDTVADADWFEEICTKYTIWERETSV